MVPRPKLFSEWYIAPEYFPNGVSKNYFCSEWYAPDVVPGVSIIRIRPFGGSDPGGHYFGMFLTVCSGPRRASMPGTPQLNGIREWYIGQNYIFPNGIPEWYTGRK